MFSDWVLFLVYSNLFEIKGFVVVVMIRDTIITIDNLNKRGWRLVDSCVLCQNA
jgi:hypothetical protein